MHLLAFSGSFPKRSSMDRGVIGTSPYVWPRWQVILGRLRPLN